MSPIATVLASAPTSEQVEYLVFHRSDGRTFQFTEVKDFGFDKESNALTFKAKEAGMWCVINFPVKQLVLCLVKYRNEEGEPCQIMIRLDTPDWNKPRT